MKWNKKKVITGVRPEQGDKEYAQTYKDIP